MSQSELTDRQQRNNRRPYNESRVSGYGESRDSRSGPTKLNDFFIDAKDIDRQVLQTEICRLLGPEARSRPYSYNVCLLPERLYIILAKKTCRASQGTILLLSAVSHL